MVIILANEVMDVNDLLIFAILQIDYIDLVVLLEVIVALLVVECVCIDLQVIEHLLL